MSFNEFLASEVIDFSDSYGSSTSISYSAINICGRPSKFPDYGDFAECFSLRSYGPRNEIDKDFVSNDENAETFHEFIVIKFEHFGTLLY